MKTTFYIKGETMSNNISLNDVKNAAFLAKQSYESNEYTIAYRGTELEDPNDFRTDARMVVSSKNNQLKYY